jgi:hypothetical protein
MVSSTPELVRRTISKLPEQYVDLVTCFMTVVHDLAIGSSERYQEKVAQLAESYFVFMLESFRAETEVMLAAPGVIRVLSLQASSSDGNLARLPHTAQLVEAVFEQFEVRLWGLIADALSGVVTLPDRGPCDFIVPVFGSLIKDRIRLVEYDNVPALKESARLAFSTVPPVEFYDNVLRFGESVLGMIRGNPQSTTRMGNGLLAFISELQRLSSDSLSDRLEPIRIELSDQKEQAPARERAFALN